MNDDQNSLIQAGSLRLSRSIPRHIIGLNCIPKLEIVAREDDKVFVVAHHKHFAPFDLLKLCGFQKKAVYRNHNEASWKLYQIGCAPTPYHGSLPPDAWINQ
jgi:hypothetical protein